jgi:hypothetical protein
MTCADILRVVRSGYFELVKGRHAMHPGRPNAVNKSRNQRRFRSGSLPLLLLALLFVSKALHAQGPTHTFQDPVYKVTFDYPANWIFSRTDGEISTFHLDARSAPANAQMRAVVAMPENPFPASTFSGAYVYFSVTPRSAAAACTQQAGAAAQTVQIAGVPFSHGHDEQKEICTTQRDEVYTSFRHGACLRFDLAINNFCGGEVSHVKDISPQELDQVRARLEDILKTVRIGQK